MLFLPLFGLRRFGELFFPGVVCGFAVEVGENDVEDVRVPVDGVAFDAFFDILLYSISIYLNQEGGRWLTSGSSSQSDMLSAGKRIFLAPARRAATVFSRRPPIRRTFPVTVNSPVIAMVGSRGWFNARESKEVDIVIPADGPINQYPLGLYTRRHKGVKVLPSFCTAPSGQCKCTRAFSKNLFSGKSCAITDLAKE